MRNCYRPLLVFSPSANDARLKRQSEILDADADDMMDRFVLFTPILPSPRASPRRSTRPYSCSARSRCRPSALSFMCRRRLCRRPARRRRQRGPAQHASRQIPRGSTRSSTPCPRARWKCSAPTPIDYCAHLDPVTASVTIRRRGEIMTTASTTPTLDSADRNSAPGRTPIPEIIEALKRVAPFTAWSRASTSGWPRTASSAWSRPEPRSSTKATPPPE